MVSGPARFFWSFAKKFLLVAAFWLLLSTLLFHFAPPVSAQTNTPAPTVPYSGSATWEFDSQVTEVGKNADRARQLLWWLFQHPGIHTAPVIAQIWAFSRNMVYIFIVLVIIAFGISLMLGKRRGSLGPVFSGISSPVLGVNVPSIFLKIAMLLLYVTFSYILIVALIQTSDITMKFFIEFVGGKDLFNIIFSGAGNTEANYITFVGYRDINPLNLEMVNTSLLFIKMTSLTYNVMSTILILRTIILWFLLIVAPFLALLMPFVFIRNVGWIWIGVFLQWLFYGPLFALFLASLTKIWVQGIPYSFDFSRVDLPSGQVYRTAINILWGGPAQTLSPGNSANYVDTYAEYFIALVMLWACIILPWLLLRIFRDYCCAGIAAAGNTLGAIFDRLRQYPPPPPSSPLGPVATSGIAQQLPFRQKIEEKIRQMDVSRIEEIRDVSKVSTNEIVKAMDLSVSKLSDISRLETNDQTRSYVASNLENIRAPERVATPATREKFMHLREELMQRSARGDRIAQTILQASDRKVESLVSRFSQVAKVTAAPKVEVKLGQVPAISDRSVIEKVSDKAGVAEIKTREVLSRISSIEEIEHKEKVETTAKAAGVSVEKVREIIRSADQIWKSTFSDHHETVREVSGETNLSETKTREILSSISETDLQNGIAVKKVSTKTGVSEEKVKEVVVKARHIAEKQQQAAVKTAAKPLTATTPVPAVTISVEDFAEVEHMWENHYRNAPVPVTEKIKNRADWLEEEEKKLTNASNLLSSANPQLKQQGLEKIAEILPFMLLGGFSEAEMLTYLKAKKEANQRVKQEMEIEEKLKAKIKEEIKAEDEETMVEVTGKKKEEEKAATLTESMVIGDNAIPDKPAETGEKDDKAK